MRQVFLDSGQHKEVMRKHLGGLTPIDQLEDTLNHAIGHLNALRDGHVTGMSSLEIVSELQRARTNISAKRIVCTRE